MIKVTKKMTLKALKNRRPDSHKGENGRVLVVGGSEEYAGAPLIVALAAKAVLRTGADISVLFAPEKVAWSANAYSPDLITYKAKGKFLAKKHAVQVIKMSEKFDCLCIGNGLGMRLETIGFVKKVMRETRIPKVVDADAIKALAGHRFKNDAIITPHLRELGIFAQKKTEATENEVRKIAQKHGCVVLVKGQTDIISDGKKTFYNTTGNPGMTIGGTGDCLAGICAALVSHKNSLLDSACAASYINGLAGDRLLRKKGFGFTATDIVEEIPYAVKSMKAMK